MSFAPPVLRRPSRGAPIRLALVGLVLMLALLLPGTAGAADPPKTLGVYAGSGSPAAITQFESNVGRPMNFVHEFLNNRTWADISDPVVVTGVMNQWRGSAYFNRLVWTIPMLPNQADATLAAGSTGTYDSYFGTLAQTLVAGGQGSATLRIGHEMNGDWFKWSIKGNRGAQFANYFRHIVTAMRAVSGANFKFDWCPIVDSSWENGVQLDAATAYPGDTYVDYIGADLYDNSWVANYQDPSARWSYYLTTKNGLNWLRSFAAAHGKPITLPEWGLAFRPDGHGGGDAPYFIKHVYDWVKANNVHHHMYFNFADPTIDATLFNGLTPLSDAMFSKEFGRS